MIPPKATPRDLINLKSKGTWVVDKAFTRQQHLRHAAFANAIDRTVIVPIE
jgi:hypothetical protein